MEQISYIKTDDNKVINERQIRWIKKLNECLEICTKSNGCTLLGGNTHRVCKINSYESYTKLNRHFE